MVKPSISHRVRPDQRQVPRPGPDGVYKFDKLPAGDYITTINAAIVIYSTFVKEIVQWRHRHGLQGLGGRAGRRQYGSRCDHVPSHPRRLLKATSRG